jgi:AAA15 family ATPase/GTPase
MAAHPIFLRRVTLKNYRSIAECSVELGALNFLVGPNGSGKSNFLDALKFTSDGGRWVHGPSRSLQNRKRPIRGRSFIL